MVLLDDDIETISEKELDMIYLARYMYKIHTDFISDRDYGVLYEKLKRVNPNHELIKRTWSDDPIPYALLKKYNIPIQTENALKRIIPEHIEELRNEYKRDIDLYAADLFNRSINLERTYEGIEKFLDKTPCSRFHMSVKADGINYSATYIRKGVYFILVDGKTRGRDSNETDITYQILQLLPNEIPVEDTMTDDILKISGEIVLPPANLPYLRDKYDKSFKTARNSVGTLLYSVDDVNDLKLLTALTFKVKSDSLTTLTKEFEWLTEHGFTTPPYITMEYDDDFTTFMTIFQNLEPLRYQLPYCSDGTVLAVDDNNEFYALGGTSTHFNGNLACKVGVWDALNYATNIIGFEWTYNTMRITPVLITEPVETITGQTVQHINAHNIRTLLELGLNLGSEVSFNYVSDCYVELAKYSID